MKEYEIYEVTAEMFKCNEHYPDTFAFVLYWTANIGFGELNFHYNTKEDSWSYDSECMGKEFCEAVLNKWLKSVMKGKEQ